MDEIMQILLKLQAGQEQILEDVSILKSDVGTLKSDVGTLKSDVGTLKSNVEILKSDVDTLKKGQARLEQNYVTLASEQEEMKLAIRSLLEMQRVSMAKQDEMAEKLQALYDADYARHQYLKKYM